ncbi:MAG: RluA family pseudouridine synthase [Bacteroidales bacterium]|nr:RluA family pseudouridine synthase [Bacteroidales bacterium]
MADSSVDFTYTVENNSEQWHLDDFLPGVFIGLETKSAVKKAIKRGQILVNQRPGSTAIILAHGDVVTWLKPLKDQQRVLPLKLEVVYEDEFLAVIHKPAGIIVSGNRFRSIENALPGNLKASGQPDALPTPLAIHRLDGLTSGLLITAKTYGAHRALGVQMQEKTIHKEYTALVMGEPDPQGEWTLPIDHKAALTRYEVLESWPSLRSGRLSLIQLFPATGRTHQLRIHLSQAGFPIVGDALYGEEGHVLKHKGLVAEQRRFLKYQE